MRTGLIPIIRSLNAWLILHYDVGFDPVDDATAEIRTKALLIVDQLELLRAMVQRYQLEKIDG
jgi:hypothetical protein